MVLGFYLNSESHIFKVLLSELGLKLKLSGGNRDLRNGLLRLVHHGGQSSEGKHKYEPIENVSNEASKNCTGAFRTIYVEGAMDNAELVTAFHVVFKPSTNFFTLSLFFVLR